MSLLLLESLPKPSDLDIANISNSKLIKLRELKSKVK